MSTAPQRMIDSRIDERLNDFSGKGGTARRRGRLTATPRPKPMGTAGAGAGSPAVPARNIGSWSVDVRRPMHPQQRRVKIPVAAEGGTDRPKGGDQFAG